ncbi:MAG: hypothetical protein HPY85_17035 [Anaerolineae bacterium]|nr:hypothetical protein [Anaerolineae bacterium]
MTLPKTRAGKRTIAAIGGGDTVREYFCPVWRVGLLLRAGRNVYIEPVEILRFSAPTGGT